MPESPTARTLKQLRKDGYTAAVVERWNPHAKIRQDLFGFIDVLAITEGLMLAVQATSTSNLSSRVEKTLASPNLPVLLSVPGVRVECWGWAKRGAVGKRKLWTLKKVEFRLSAEGVAVVAPSLSED